MVEAIFVSHGSPTLLIEDGEYVELLKKLGREYKSKGIDLIMVSSPHWISHEDFLCSGFAKATVHSGLLRFSG
jgi:aromatic ring-opening dioxygenase catalytic subunit (LigB family)